MRALLLALTLGLALAPAGWAQTKPKAPPRGEPRTAALAGGGAAPAGRLLTRDELRDCLQRQQVLGERRTELDRSQATLDGEKAELLKAGEALQAELAALDRTSADAVAAYNARAAERDSKVDAWNQRNTRFVDEARAHQADQKGWADACAGRRYREDDEIALRRGK